MKPKPIILLFFAFSFFSSYAQTTPTQFSVATDAAAIRSFKKYQRFWTIGQTISAQFHFAPKDALIVWFHYSVNADFDNRLVAYAKDTAAVPQQPAFTSSTTMRFNHISTGWKHYLKGSFNSESWNLYGYAGFGLMFGQVRNAHSPAIDTANYHVPVFSGSSNFKRLTFDLGSGIELPAGGNVYFYLEARALVPATDYPNRHLLINNDAPFFGSANAGIRILFD